MISIPLIFALQICKKFNNQEAFQRAISNVENYYPVVGITEYINITLNVMEHTLPEYFLGATNVYYDNQDVRLNLNINKEKHHVSEMIVENLRKNFTLEIEFYEFCKQRLFSQYHNLLSAKSII